MITETITQIEIQDLQVELENRIVKFVYEKLDGTLRDAIGTRSLEHIPTQCHPKGCGVPKTKSLPYYDIEKEAWRSMSAATKTYIVKII